VSTENSVPFRHISDTARFVALLRAMESERPDAHFHDPFAMRFIGDRESALREFARRTKRFDSRLMAVRTKVLDDGILELVREQRVDCVLNLAAGLDTRPYRMRLPNRLRWIEVDLPGILQEKAELLKGERPHCRMEQLTVDLVDGEARRALFDRIAKTSRQVLVLTEGLLMYLPVPAVSELATELHQRPAFKYWLMDLLSPGEIAWLRKTYGKSFAKANTQVYFGPPEGPDFFRSYGWKPLRYQSGAEEAYRLRRERPSHRMMRWLSPITPPAVRERNRVAYGFALLER
jgi:methyltransferase (TIGR00027 family)